MRDEPGLAIEWRAIVERVTKADRSYRRNLWRVVIEREQLLGLYNLAVGNIDGLGTC